MICQGDALSVLKTLDNESIQMCVTSPPYYGLRDYGEDGQIGLEDTPEQFIQKLVEVFREVRRVLKDDGTLWVNIGDSYCGTGDKGNYKDPKYANGRNGQSILKTKNIDGIKHKDLIGIPWMLAFALRADGWYLRQDIIWHKPNPMPESVKDRCTKSHEYMFLLTKSPKYYFDHEAIQEDAVRVEKGKPRFGGLKYGLSDDPKLKYYSGNEYTPNGKRNKRDVWSVCTKPYSAAHFATYPEELILPCILAGSKHGDTVLDPFNGAATTGVVCAKNGREYIGIELNPEYIKISEDRISKVKEEIEQQKKQISFW